MRDKVFLDTNLWFYLYSDDDKSTVVANLIKKEFDHIILSTQVQSELFNAITRKQLKTAIEAAELIADLRTTYEVVGIDQFTVATAIQIHLRYQYSYYDSLIIAAALENDCATLYTEDLQSGQLIEEVLIIINPFCPPVIQSA
jgi:predicted nucleic acid-binding protein